MLTCAEAYDKHIETITELAINGDETAIRSLCAIALILHGWRPGDPDPVDFDPDPNGGEVIELFRKAA